MKKIIYLLLIMLVLPLFSGCEKNTNNTWLSDSFIECTKEEKENKNCNDVYTPVCGDDWQTYWNACSACSSEKINSYKEWACECDEEVWVCSTVFMDDWQESAKYKETIIEVPSPNF